jgi:hypothetical protein
MQLIEIISGNSEGVGDRFFKPKAVLPRKDKGEAQEHIIGDEEPSAQEVAKVKRELTENCVVSELLSTMVLFTVVCVDMFLDSIHAPGAPSLTFGLTHGQRTRVLSVYSVILCFQILAIFVSHKVRHIRSPRWLLRLSPLAHIRLICHICHTPPADHRLQECAGQEGRDYQAITREE